MVRNNSVEFLSLPGINLAKKQYKIPQNQKTIQACRSYGIVANFEPNESTQLFAYSKEEKFIKSLPWNLIFFRFSKWTLGVVYQ